MSHYILTFEVEGAEPPSATSFLDDLEDAGYTVIRAHLVQHSGGTPTEVPLDLHRERAARKARANPPPPAPVPLADVVHADEDPGALKSHKKK